MNDSEEKNIKMAKLALASRVAAEIEQEMRASKLIKSQPPSIHQIAHAAATRALFSKLPEGQ